MLPTEVAQIADDIVRLGGAVVAQAIGIIYAAFLTLRETYSPLGSMFALHRCRLYVGASNAVDPSRPFNATWGAAKPNTLMQAVKHQFDPIRTLNPGRLAGDI